MDEKTDEVRRVLFAPEFLVSLTRGRFEIVENPLPRNLKLLRVEEVFPYVALVVSSPDFDADTPDPLPLPVIRRLDDAYWTLEPPAQCRGMS